VARNYNLQGQSPSLCRSFLVQPGALWGLYLLLYVSNREKLIFQLCFCGRFVDLDLALAASFPFYKVPLIKKSNYNIEFIQYVSAWINLIMNGCYQFILNSTRRGQ